MKETSATGKLRHGLEINERVQDGLKLYWLCGECEKKLNIWETYFANKIFYPLINNTDKISYDKKFLKFCVSVSWRILKYFHENGYTSHFQDELQDCLNKALIVWHDFLLDKIENPGSNEQHFYNFTGEIRGDNLQSNIHRYLQRSIQVDVIHNSHTAFVYIKLPNFLIVGYISLIDGSKWRKTRVCVNKGILRPQKYNFPKELWKYIQEKAARTNELKDSMSDRQKKKISDSYRTTPDKAIESETFKSLEKDLKFFGIDEVFKGNKKI